MKKIRQGLGFVLAATLLVAGCGGGSSGTSSTSGTVSNATQNGTFALAVTGGTTPGIKHAWLTVYKVAVNADPDKAWDASDTSWKVVTLTTPVTFDLAAAAAFVVGSASSGITLPSGTYEQVRLFLKAHDATKVTSAAALTYNAQLEYDDGTVVPIEIPNIESGLKLDRGVVIETNKSSLLKTTFDVDRSIVRFNANGDHDAVTLRPRTYTYGFNPLQTASITGALDPTLICGSVSHPGATGCATDITVSLMAPSGDGTRMENWGTVKVNPTRKNTAGTADIDDGTFELGPVSHVSGDGNPTSYDVVIRGRGMKTMVVKGVAFTLITNYIGCSWSSDAGDGSTTKSYIQPILDSSPRTVTLAGELSPTSGRTGLGFKLTSTGLPYEVHSANVDPFTGVFASGVNLSIPGSASMDVLTADYSTLSTCASTAPSGSGLILPFSTTSVSSYQSFALGTFYTDASISATTYTAGSTFSADSPVTTNLPTGTLNVTVTGVPVSPSSYQARLVVSDVGGIVYTQDISSALSAGSWSGSVTVPRVPSNTPRCHTTEALSSSYCVNADGAGVYEVAVRYWDPTSTTTAKSSLIPSGTMKWARSSTLVNLRDGNTTGSASITAN